MPDSQTPAAARRPRVHFNPDLARQYEMGMIQAGWETLEALHRLRYLTSWQVAKLFFLGRPNHAGALRGQEAARKAANERCLRRLKDRQLVETRQVMLTHGTSWMRREYNVLTRTGHLLLRDHLAARGVNPPEWSAARHEIAPEALAHALLINDVAIALTRSCEHHHWTLLAWIDDFAARAVQGQTAFTRFVPDAAALVEYRGVRALYFIEVDRGTEPVASDAGNSWRTKMQRYRTYLSEVFPEDPFFRDAPLPLLLTTTTTIERLRHLMAETRTSGDPERSWFALSAWMEPPYDMLGAVWQRPFDQEIFFSLQDEMALRAAHGAA